MTLSPPTAMRALVAAVVLELAVALVGLAALPTGAATPEGVVPRNARVAARADVRDARVLLLSEGGRLRVLVAYPEDKGWFGVGVRRPPPTASVAWAATPGSDDIPPLAVLYGRLDGARVVVRWQDGEVQEARPASDGTFLAARGGRVRSNTVEALGPDGSVLTRIDGP